LFKPPSGTFNFKYVEGMFGKNMTVTNNGRTISAKLQDGSMSTLGGISLVFNGAEQWFSLSSIDIKARSDHTLRGKHYPLEIQLVHRPAHFYKDSDGPEAVTLSIFVDCPDPPQAKEVYPGLLQVGEAPKPRRLRGNRSAAFLQQTPSSEGEVAVSTLSPPPYPEDDVDGVDDDPVHLRMNAELNFVHSLVEGGDALSANAPAPAPGPGPAGAEDNETLYIPPPATAPSFNALLQFLVAEEPPELDSTTIVALSPQVRLKPAAMVADGTYFYYWGSQTLPPCASKDMWLIKREPMAASTQQVTELFDTLHLMSQGAGNFRTSMPLNGRVVEVLSPKEGIPKSLITSPLPANDAPSGPEQKYMEASQDAITLAKAASDYARDLDLRVQAGAVAHLNKLTEGSTTTFAPTTSMFIPKPPDDSVWATNIMSDVLKSALKKAVEENVKEMIPATASLTISYLRQRILHNAGFHLPPPKSTLLKPTPLPGIPTFMPPMTVMPAKLDKKNTTFMIELLNAANCTSTNSTCTGIEGLSPHQAHKYIAKLCRLNVPGFFCYLGQDGMDDDDDQMTPEEVQPFLPAGVDAVAANWPDPDCGKWGDGLPPDGIPPWNSDWPDPSGSKPADWDDYTWQQYKWNWQVYNSQYKPYKSSYQGYSINRRRRFTAQGYNSAYSSYNSGYSSGSRRRGYSSYSGSSGYSSGRRRSYSSYGSGSSSSYSSGRRRSYSSYGSSSSSSYSSGRRRSYSSYSSSSYSSWR
jgi:carbonic anhydrase